MLTITTAHYLVLAAILFSLSVAGIFINRKNVILLLMCIELMLLAVNFNFVAFSRQLGDLHGQVFVFFILTVAAAESAIGLAILVVLFRERKSINVEQLDTMNIIDKVIVVGVYAHDRMNEYTRPGYEEYGRLRRDDGIDTREASRQAVVASIVQVGPVAFKSRTEAEAGMKTITVCSSN